jgi:deoxyribodipyrimidine photo-lyase
MADPVIIWFRQDLRLADNPALTAAIATGQPIIPIYILDDINAGPWKLGGASRVWLHHSLTALNKSLDNKLQLFTGDAEKIIPAIVKETSSSKVFWNRCYEPWRIARDKRIKENLAVPCHSENGSLLWEPWAIKKPDGTPYRVFTPYFRRGCLGAEPPRQPLPAPSKLNLFKSSPHSYLVTGQDLGGGEAAISNLNLLPKSPRWDTGIMSHWTAGEAGAHQRLTEFFETGLKGYKEGRNIPSLPKTSRLSPHLQFGEISPNQIWYASQYAGIHHKAESDLDTFHSELGWREFSHSLLYYNPTLPEEPLNKRYINFEWAGVDEKLLDKWRTGHTGYPIVDAGMRELWATGYMHNRVRMIVGSFLVKDFRYHWRHGEDWFWDTLVDASLANNAASWQWIAGCGADAAPYFRVFNPTTQGEKFDPKGIYVNQWARDSWDIKPVIDHAEARIAALAAFKNMG